MTNVNNALGTRALYEPYQNAIELLAKRDFHGCKLSLCAQVLCSLVILRRHLPYRFAQVCLGHRGFDLLVGLDLRGAIQETIH